MARRKTAQSTLNAGRAPIAVCLVGFMGAGKTTVGRSLAERMGWRFVDLDDRVEARERRTIAHIFRDSGESAFRQAEAEALLELLAEIGVGTNTVIALGGGAFVQPENANAIRRSGIPVAFLDAPVDELRERCAAKGGVRPLFRNADEFRRLYEDRRRSYMQADLLVSTSAKTVCAVVDELISRLNLGKE